MPFKFLIRSAAVLTVVVSAILLIQSCSKNPAQLLKTVTQPDTVKKDSVKKPIHTTAYQDTVVTQWFKRNSNSLGSIAFDQAFSIPLANGQVYWLFGDTYYKDLNANGRFACFTDTTGPGFNLHNSVLIQPSTSNWTQSATVNATNGPGTAGAQLFTAYNPSNKTNNYFWPLTGIEVNGKVYVYLFKLNGLTVEPPKIAIVDETSYAVDTTSYTLPDLNNIQFNIGMFKAADGYIYIYGYKTTGVFGNTNIYVARMQPTSTTWTFWNGSSWGSSAAAATVVATTSSNAVSVSYINNKFVIISCAWNFGCGNDDSIFASASSRATGGFSSAIKIYDVPDRLNGRIPFFYTPLIHPEFTANNEFLFTYCINYYTQCINPCTNSTADPDQYRPRAVRVPFSVLGL